MPATYTIRRFDPGADLSALTDLYNVIQNSHLTPEDVQARITSWPGHDPAHDRFVAVDDQQLLGMSLLIPQSPQRSFVQASVHPGFRRQGIGRALLERVVAEAGERGASQVVGDFPWNDADARTFAEACGFRLAGEVRFFTAPADLTLPEPVLPPGFVLRSIAEVGDLQAFADACNRCYADMWGHYENLVPVTVEKLEEWHANMPNLRPEGMFVLSAPDGSLVGVTRASADGEGEQSTRLIDSPGVAPQYRVLALQRPLVQKAAAWLKEHAQGPYRLETWGDTPEAVQIYLAAGFTLDESNHGVEVVRDLA